MKVVIVNKEHKCGFGLCAAIGKKIAPGQIAIRFLRWVKGEEGNRWETTYFHPECWKQVQAQYIVGIDTVVKEKEDIIAGRRTKSGRSRGRPKKYMDILKARNISQLRNHHRRKGNWGRVTELEAELRELEV